MPEARAAVFIRLQLHAPGSGLVFLAEGERPGFRRERTLPPLISPGTKLHASAGPAAAPHHLFQGRDNARLARYDSREVGSVSGHWSYFASCSILVFSRQRLAMGAKNRTGNNLADRTFIVLPSARSFPKRARLVDTGNGPQLEPGLDR